MNRKRIIDIIIVLSVLVSVILLTNVFEVYNRIKNYFGNRIEGIEDPSYFEAIEVVINKENDISAPEKVLVALNELSGADFNLFCYAGIDINKTDTILGKCYLNISEPLKIRLLEGKEDLKTDAVYIGNAYASHPGMIDINGTSLKVSGILAPTQFEKNEDVIFDINSLSSDSIKKLVSMLMYMYDDEQRIRIPVYCYSDDDIVSAGIEKLKNELQKDSIVIARTDKTTVPVDNVQAYFYNIIKLLLVILSVFFSLLALIGAENVLLDFNRREIMILKIYGYSSHRIAITLFSSLIKDIIAGILLAGAAEMLLYVVMFKYTLTKTYAFFALAILIDCLLIWIKMYINIVLIRIRKSNIADITGF